MKIFLPAAFMILLSACIHSNPKNTMDPIHYSPHKWIIFTKEVKLSWNYEDPAKIHAFQLDREVVLLNHDQVKELYELAREVENNTGEEKSKALDKINNIENELNKEIRYDRKYIKLVPEDMSFVDREKPSPSYGEIWFYKIRACGDSDLEDTLKCEPHSDWVKLSVILLDRHQ